VSRGLPRRRTADQPTERKALLAQLEARASAWKSGTSGAAPARPAANALRACATQLSACLADEVDRVHPLVRSRLPIETGTLDVVRDEHATLTHLVSLLHDRLGACERGEPGADATVGVVLRDLVDVWRTHVRRFDQVIDPLLARLDRPR
jgi:hypothetical protein